MSEEIKKVATRQAYGERLAELGERHPEIVVLDADLSGSTKTAIFAKKFPKRFFNVGVAEQDLMGTAAGLAHSGHTVFASTFTMFATGRAWEIVRQSICYPHLNVKICSSHAGITVGEDGASHQVIEDIALMRVIPGMKVFVPADEHETRAMMDFMVQDRGPTFMRLGRANVDPIFDSSFKFEPGKGHVLREGREVCLFTTGYVTKACLDAAEQLSEQGIEASVVSLGSIKPIDSDLIARMAKTHDHLFSVEEHTTVAGFGSAIAEVLTSKEPKILHRLGLQDEFGQSGPANELLAHYGLDAEGIKKSVLKVTKGTA
ncbi:MAG: transketolase family protein [Deltaproteobacteria bacterium]|nr:transketolase family protein [Deltaproteobacteria bacterium]